MGRCATGKASRDRPQCRSGALEKEEETDIACLARSFLQWSRRREPSSGLRYSHPTASLDAVTTRPEAPIASLEDRHGRRRDGAKTRFESRWGHQVVFVRVFPPSLRNSRKFFKHETSRLFRQCFERLPLVKTDCLPKTRGAHLRVDLRGVDAGVAEQAAHCSRSPCCS